MTPRKIAIIQARMASSRLPGKVLMDIQGEPMLKRVVERTRRAGAADDVIVATTTAETDDAIVEFCKGAEIPFFRGSHFDVLDRYFASAKSMQAEVVIRITADCPLIDAGLIDATVHTLEMGGGQHTSPQGSGAPVFDLSVNRLPPPWTRTFPIGLDTEVCTFAALERAWREAKEPADREHVMAYMYRGVKLEPKGAGVSSGVSLQGFRVALLDYAEDLGAWRWTVDTAEDLEFVRQVYGNLAGHTGFGWQDVVRLIKDKPELADINARVKHKAVFDTDSRAGEAGQE